MSEIPFAATIIILLAILVIWFVAPLLLHLNFGYTSMITYFACLLALCAFVERAQS